MRRALWNRIRRIEGNLSDGPPWLMVGCYDPARPVRVFHPFGRILDFPTRAEFEVWRQKGAAWA